MTTTPLLALLRKDVRSLAGKVGAMALTLVVVVVGAIVREPDDAVGIVGIFLGGYAVAGALFLATTVAVGERADGTLDFARALPVARWKIATSRVLVGLVACIVPILVAVLIVWTWNATRAVRETGGRPVLLDESFLFASGGIAIGSATMVYLLAVTAAAHQPTELRAAARGFGALLAWLALIPVAALLRPSVLLVAASPVGLVVTASGEGSWRVTILAQLVLDLALCGLALRRYGRLAPPGRHPAARRGARRGANRNVRGHRSPLFALAWKESREAFPIVGLGLVVTALLTSWIVFAEPHGSDVNRLVVIKNTLIPVTYGLATLVALVVGVGSFVGELQPGLHEFWRTRPIDVRRWYFLKTLVAGAIVLLAFSAPIVVVLALESTTSDADGLVFLACAPPLIIFSLTIAIAITCLARRALYASILSFAAIFTVVTIPARGLAPDALDVAKVVRDCGEAARQGLSFIGDAQYLLYVTLMLVLASAVSAIGLAAVRRGWDLGRRG